MSPFIHSLGSLKFGLRTIAITIITLTVALFMGVNGLDKFSDGFGLSIRDRIAQFTEFGMSDVIAPSLVTVVGIFQVAVAFCALFGMRRAAILLVIAMFGFFIAGGFYYGTYTMIPDHVSWVAVFACFYVALDWLENQRPIHDRVRALIVVIVILLAVVTIGIVLGNRGLLLIQMGWIAGCFLLLASSTKIRGGYEIACR